MLHRLHRAEGRLYGRLVSVGWWQVDRRGELSGLAFTRRCPTTAAGDRGSPRPLPPAPARRFSQRSIGLGDGSGSRSGDRPRADPGDSHPPRLGSRPRGSSVPRQCGECPAATGRAGRAAVMSRVLGERHAASASRTPGLTKAMLGAGAGAQRRSVNTRHVNGSQRHPHDLTTYHWGPEGCHLRQGGGADQTMAPRTGTTRTST